MQPASVLVRPRHLKCYRADVQNVKDSPPKCTYCICAHLSAGLPELLHTPAVQLFLQGSWARPNGIGAPPWVANVCMHSALQLSTSSNINGSILHGTQVWACHSDNDQGVLRMNMLCTESKHESDNRNKMSADYSVDIDIATFGAPLISVTC